ncbi:uncharacterized protein PFL1_03548 [Pseudozyma flocculosa PF-1]|uniref:C2H2-type domain-containing protein n=2 Tax=Pseudozyma flocculosa TaxID=84751 RepID=A0A5C3F4Q0_9BASI|nr:uncharacterized protein PFL1_03548 [Pseudozyma flocculosa PF-1]EPQ28745.1 hypothetical protein PFL1_03548 [Pseudozyma flocculosa PF-1]SPO39483.1 uncharacterized protein PSFLO_04964 [Pseudozyma flocculosa]
MRSSSCLESSTPTHPLRHREHHPLSPQEPPPDALAAPSSPFRLTPSERGSPTEFIRQALANTQWPSSPPPQKPAIRHHFDPLEALASPRPFPAAPADRAREAGAESALHQHDIPVTSLDLAAAVLAHVAATATDNAPLTPSADRSPAEGYFSDSVDSPASARDFLTSPSLFDDCDFDFESQGRPLLPLFPGTTFDSQVNEALPHDLIDDSTAYEHAEQQQQQQQPLRPASPSPQANDMGQRQSLPQNELGPQQVHAGQAGRGTMMDELRKQGLSCYVVEPDSAKSAAAPLTPYESAFYAGIRTPSKELDEGLTSDNLDRASMEHHLRALVADIGVLSQNGLLHNGGDGVMSSSGNASRLNDAAAHDGGLSLYESIGRDSASVDGHDGEGTGVNPRKRTYSTASSSTATPERDSASPSKKYIQTGKVAATTAKLPKGRRFQCEVCQKWFDRAFNLKTHMYTHENPDARAKNFICPDPDCGKPFARKHDMNRHHTTVHLKTVRRSSPPKKSPTASAHEDEQG